MGRIQPNEVHPEINPETAEHGTGFGPDLGLGNQTVYRVATNHRTPVPLSQTHWQQWRCTLGRASDEQAGGRVWRGSRLPCRRPEPESTLNPTTSVRGSSTRTHPNSQDRNRRSANDPFGDASEEEPVDS